MKKLINRTFSIGIILLLTFNVKAKEISISDAETIATNFIKDNTLNISTSANSSLKLAYTAKSATILGKSSYYVFNKGINDGFIIISADDCVHNEVLGYSCNGNFNFEEIPSNIKWWLEQYQREIDYAVKNNLQSTPIIRSYATSVSPLLGRIAWDQGDPYNFLCPTLTNSKGETEHTVTGCVATATAQLMRYHKWPAKGTGSNSYTWKNGGKTLSMDFSQSTYDWNNMTETYNSNSSTAEKNAVAKLMYDCGISCNMNYGLSETGGSGASAIDQVTGLYRFFNYDIGMKHINRNYYKLSDWESLIKTEIDNKRPVLYRGIGTGGGHAFIIDGYNNNGYFHFNWGWGGNSNGYFVTTALNPGELGIGGGAGGYNYEQGMTIGVQPAQTSSVASFEITSDGLDFSGNPSDGFKITINRIANSNWQSATFDAAFKFTPINGSAPTLLSFMQNQGLNSYYYFSPITYSANTLANYLANGEYKISLVTRITGTSTWYDMPTLLGTAEYIYITIKDGKATNVTYDQTSLPNLSVTGYELNDKLYINRVATISATVKNSGAEYLGDMALVFADANGNILATSGLLMTNILEGETKEIKFDYTMISAANGVSITSETPCTMYLFGDASSNSNFNIGKLGNVTLYPVGSGSPALAFTKAPKVNNSTEDNVSITLGLINNGSIFKDAITFYTWDKDLDYEYCGGISQYAMLENKESKEIIFSFPYEGIVGHTYLVNIYANNVIIKGNTSSINYTCSFVLGKSTGIESIKTNYEMTVTNTNNILDISTEQNIKQINVYNSAGMNVAHKEYSGYSNNETISLESQPAGVYVIKVITIDGIKTSKVCIQ